MNSHRISPQDTFSLVTVVATVCAALLVLTACGPTDSDSSGNTIREPARASDHGASRNTVPERSAVPDRGPVTLPTAIPVVAREPAPVPPVHMGRITRIETVSTPGKTNGSGALIGGVVGAAVGNQFGHGGERAIGTGLGAVGGAMVSSEIERRNKAPVVSYRIHVRLDNGESRTFAASSNDGLRVGDRVRVEGKLLRRA